MEPIDGIIIPAELGRTVNPKCYHFVEGLAQYHFIYSTRVHGKAELDSRVLLPVMCTLRHPF